MAGEIIMNNDDLLVEIELLIASKREGDYWDFKEKHHSNKADLLHDIICMANNRVDKDGYIIFGVSDNYEIKGTENDENRRNQQGIIDFLKSKKFSGGVRPTIEMKTLVFYDEQVDLLIIKNSTDTPFFILDDYSDKKRKVRANAIYTRTGDANTDIDKSADINHIEYLWKKRFLLNRPPLEQIKQKLQQKSEWKRDGDNFYNIFNPEFTITLQDDDRRGHPEFYSYLMMNISTSYGTLEIKCFGTKLYSQGFTVLDSGRYLTVVPEWGFIENQFKFNETISYRYYIKGTLNYILHEFLSEDDHEAVMAKKRFYKGIVIYNNELEKELFEEYIYQNISFLTESINNIDDPYEWLETESEQEKQDARTKIQTGEELNRLLDKFRNER